MISCELIGRLGNQLMQIAATIGFSLNNNEEYHIPNHTMNDSVWKPQIKHLTNTNFNPGLKATFLREEKHSFNYLPFYPDWKDETNVILSGYWQSYKYWYWCIHEIREAFNFDYTTFTGLTGIHWRFGDYRMYPTKHPICSDEYMARAIEVFTKLGHRRFIFFSDEIDECKNFVSKYFPLRSHVSFAFSEDKSELEDFRYLLRCQNQIITNSTFGLMAALLNSYPDKIVVSPDANNWFGTDNKHLSTEDLLPDSFIQIRTQ